MSVTVTYTDRQFELVMKAVRSSVWANSANSHAEVELLELHELVFRAHETRKIHDPSVTPERRVKTT